MVGWHRSRSELPYLVGVGLVAALVNHQTVSTLHQAERFLSTGGSALSQASRLLEAVLGSFAWLFRLHRRLKSADSVESATFLHFSDASFVKGFSVGGVRGWPCFFRPSSN